MVATKNKHTQQEQEAQEMTEMTEMTVKEITRRIQSYSRRKKKLIIKIDEIKADIRATNKALHFWKQELIRAKKTAR